jgi:hypothetical protein
MFKLLSGLASLFIYFMIGTVLFQTGALAWAWWQGLLTADRVKQSTLVLYGLDPTDLKASLIEEPLATPTLTYSDIQNYRSKMTLDLDLRESSLVSSADDLTQIEGELASRRRRFERIRTDFESTMARLQGAATDQTLKEVRDTFKSLKPEQAAEQFVRLIDRSRTSGEMRYRDDMVTILKTLPEATQRKILAEFKNEDKAEYLYEMLTQIRLGMPDVDAIRSTRTRLEQYRRRSLEPGIP